MFIRLGMLSILRQLSRSALVLVSLVLAAISLTASLTISSGYPLEAYRNYRDYFGGDLVVYPVRIMTSPAEQGHLSLYRLQNDEFSTLPIFYPHVADVGFLSASEPHWRPLTDSDLDSVVGNPSVSAVRPLYRMPGWRGSLPVAFHALDENDALLRYLDDSPETQLDQGDIGVWLNRMLKPGPSLPEVGEQITLTVPTFLVMPDGSINISDTQVHAVTATVMGFYQLPTRVVTWMDGQAPNGVASEQGYFALDEVWLSYSDWLRLWELGAPGQSPLAFSYAASVRNMDVLEATVSELQVNHPDLTIVSVPNLARVASKAVLIDYFYSVPPRLLTTDARPQMALPEDMGRLLSLFIYLNAGLLMAARMLTGISARKKEIGILKALGARRRDIMVMAVSEAVVLSIIGSTAGFLVTYLAALMQQLTNHVALISILTDFIRSYGIVFGETVAVGLVFGMIPAWRLSNLTVSEVLRS